MPAPLLTPKAGITLLLGLSSFTTALAGPVEARQTESATTPADPSVSTVTGYAHPLTLTPLTTLNSQQTPLSYASPPTPITVPTRVNPPGSAGAAQASKVQAEEAAAPADTGATAVCTTIAGDYPTATIPNFCNPSAHINAASFVPDRVSNLPTATVTIGAVSNKLDCCVQCAEIFNCIAWSFVPVYTQAPNARLPGGFDPWGRGDCQAVYHTGNPDNTTAAGEDTANLCPNGKVGEVLAVNASANTDGNATSWSNLYYNGWNEGACAEPVAAFEGGSDKGMGDPDSLCS
ncbi:uncharacterized protein F4822DRAFT_55627 [Hypoxylon trugodes]|uniref:uncharacterized protein n=1 Tax=Hypoxylon trugodes TaxID=326681 RepID=UPI00218F9C3C|nr:uncharacterized protein F4822DRAFT_55627 [Hypoxylon trugodes]KAI1383926.1 hypothetical protein F4822DRAFT_55627 [Hypoxylon trugodes]